MEKEFAKTKLLINKILKNLGDSSLDWTIQVSENTANPGKISYGCMIHASERLEPITWVCDSWEDLQKELKKAGKELNRDMIDVAYYKSEQNRCDRLKAYYEEKVNEILGVS